jgi:hypothetical protein
MTSSTIRTVGPAVNTIDASALEILEETSAKSARSGV